MADMEANKQRVDIDPDGEVLLQLPEAEVRVSSRVLSLASKVFRAMLSPHFAEGSAFRDGTLEVDMPEDDTKATITLCSVLHHRYDDIQSSPTLEFLSKLAVAADKYDCVLAVSQWSGHHLSDLTQNAESNINYRLLYLAYAFNDYRRFQHISRLLVYSRSSAELHAAARDSSEDMDRIDKPSLWMKVITKILEAQENTMRCLLFKLEDALSRVLGKKLLAEGPYRGPDPKDAVSHTSYFFAECDSTHISMYILELRRQIMWPLAQAGGTWDVDKMLSKLNNCVFQPMAKAPNGKCETCNLDFAKIIHDARQNIQDAFSGLCLDCIKHGELATQDGVKCRIVHEGYLGV